MITATYSLSNYLASFEFFNWLVMVQAEGAEKIYFDTRNPKLKNFNSEDVLHRFISIIEPGPILAGLESEFGCKPGPAATPSQLLAWYNSGKRFKRLKAPHRTTCDYTVTIRDNHAGAKARDSNREVWCEFARRIGAVLIDDYYNQRIHLYDRMALYAGAKMNFGVCNGPIHLLSLTEYPVAMFVNGPSARNSQIRWGIQPNSKYPWMLDNQSIIWKDDASCTELLKIFDGMKL